MTQGRVYLIGAGPGDPELLTLRAVRALGEADVVLVDELVDDRCLAFTKARIVPVGKRAGCASTPQAFIEKLMIHLARAGNIVARLKGGDPFVFGRGGEELAALEAAGIAVEVVPGITAELGIALTQRGRSHGVTFITGHSSTSIDWAALYAAATTLVIYMGLARVREIVAGMLAGGFAPATPACAAQQGTRPGRRAVYSPLGCLPEAVEHARLAAPALIVVGEVVRRSAFQLEGAIEARVHRNH
jgi:uroporphyrin-III C-methyltransferase